jgi:hypothetical protein
MQVPTRRGRLLQRLETACWPAVAQRPLLLECPIDEAWIICLQEEIEKAVSEWPITTHIAVGVTREVELERLHQALVEEVFSTLEFWLLYAVWAAAEFVSARDDTAFFAVVEEVAFRRGRDDERVGGEIGCKSIGATSGNSAMSNGDDAIVSLKATVHGFPEYVDAAIHEHGDEHEGDLGEGESKNVLAASSERQRCFEARSEATQTRSELAFSVSDSKRAMRRAIEGRNKLHRDLGLPNVPPLSCGRISKNREVSGSYERTDASGNHDVRPFAATACWAASPREVRRLRALVTSHEMGTHVREYSRNDARGIAHYAKCAPEHSRPDGMVSQHSLGQAVRRTCGRR